jgi:methionyl aminopeptidase
VNEVICHGIPDDRALVDGDIVNVDVTVFLDGVHGDTNATFLVGRADPRSKRLVQVTRECLDRAIAAVRPGVPVSDLGRAIEQHATDNGFFVVRTFVGHGIGEVFPDRHRCCTTDLRAYDPRTDDVHHRADDHHGSIDGRIWDDG